MSDLTVDDDRASLSGVVYSPYFALRPPELMEQATATFAYLLEQQGLKPSGEVTFTQHDNPLDVTEHAYNPLWITGPWHHRYTIGASVEKAA